MTAPAPWWPKPADIPVEPGVYRWLDAAGRVLYVGKAKRLRQRLANYFAAPETLPERTRRMVAEAASVEWTVVRNEIEALQLEYATIQELTPPFNVRLKDDKSYPYLAITLADEAPRVLVTRNRHIRGAKYFGPYPKVWAVNEVIDLMIRVMPIRTCSDANYREAMRTGQPCFNGQIGRCGGPCSQRVSVEEHRERVAEFVRILETYDRTIVDELEAQMRQAAAEQRYEDAAVLRDRIRAFEAVLAKSAVVLPGTAEADVYGLAEDELAASVQLFTVRAGRLRGVRGWVLDKELDLDTPTLMQQILQDVYGAQGQHPAREIIVPTRPADAEALEAVLRELRGARIRIHEAQRGVKAQLQATAHTNAQQALGQYKLKRTADFIARSDALTDLRDALGMAEAPLRIEGYDISHLQGTGVVGSMVVFEDGLAKKRDYRRFNIAQTRDDTDSIEQVLSRRLAYLRAEGPPEQDAAAQDAQAQDAQAQDAAADTPADARPARPAPGDRPAKFAYRPGLLLIDGGAPQVAAAARALAAADVGDIPIAGIAKRLEELWLPGEAFPVILPRSSEALFLIQRIRDEAHRFAITAQRASRSRSIRSQLEQVPGLGPRRIRELLTHFGSVKRLREASVDELCEVRGIGAAAAASIHAHLHPHAADTR